jgi:hypothetical protein
MTLAFRPSPDYGSGGLAMAVLADAAPCGPVPGRTCKRQWTVRLPAVQPGRCRSVRVPLPPSRVSTVPAACGLRCPQAASAVHTSGPPVSAGCADLARNPGRPRNRRPRQCPLDVRECRPGAAGRPPSAADTAAAPEQGRDMAIAGGRPSMHARPATAVDANRPHAVSTAAAEPRPGRLSRPGCPPHGVLPQPADTAAVSTVLPEPRPLGCRPDGWCPPRTPPPAGVRCYRKRSPDRWRLVWCRHRR